MDTINLSLPTAWADLTGRQLRFAYHQIARQLPAEQVKARCLFQWAGLTVIARTTRHRYIVRHCHRTVILTPRQVEAATHALDFLDTIPPTPVRLEKLHTPHYTLHTTHFTLHTSHYTLHTPHFTLHTPHFSLHTPHFTLHTKRASALTADFQGVEFEKYLFLDNLYQGYLHTHDDHFLTEMATILYDCDNLRPTKPELVSIFYWWASLKNLFAREFPHFLRPIAEQKSDNLLSAQQSLYSELKESMNAQIRALTGGDITKESAIKKLDTWRALTELDAKAKESEDLARIHKK